PRSSMLICGGPRRATSIAASVGAAVRRVNQNTAAPTSSNATTMRQRGCFFTSSRGFAIVEFLPLSVFFDVENAHVRPELQPRDSVAHERLRDLVLRRDEIVLRVHLVLLFR